MFSDNKLKNVVMWLLAICLVSFGTAWFLFSLPGGKTVSDGLSSAIGGQTYKIDETKSSSINNITKISIGSVSTDVNIIPDDGDEVKVHFYGEAKPRFTTDLPKLNMETGSGSVSFSIQYPHNFSGSMNLKLDVYVPKKYSRDFTINTTSGDTRINDITLEDFNYKSVSGSIEAGSLSTKSASLGSTSGDIKLTKLAGDSDLGTVSGHINIDSLTSGTTSVNSTSGDIDIKDFTGNIKAGSVSGSISLWYSKFDNNVTLKTTSGDCELKLPENSSFKLDARSTSGGIKCDFPVVLSESGRNSVVGNVGDGAKEISIRTVSGSIKIIK